MKLLLLITTLPPSITIAAPAPKLTSAVANEAAVVDGHADARVCGEDCAAFFRGVCDETGIVDDKLAKALDQERATFRIRRYAAFGQRQVVERQRAVGDIEDAESPVAAYRVPVAFNGDLTGDARQQPIKSNILRQPDDVVSVTGLGSRRTANRYWRLLSGRTAGKAAVAQRERAPALP